MEINCLRSSLKPLLLALPTLVTMLIVNMKRLQIENFAIELVLNQPPAQRSSAERGIVLILKGSSNKPMRIICYCINL
jgi:hypothetical protein